MNEPKDRVAAALRALADADRSVEAPPHIELTLRARFRRSALQRRRQHSIVWIGLAAAAAIVIAAILARFPHREPVRTQLHPPAVSTASREIMTDFFPLMDDPPPVDHGELVRVSLPAAAMRTVGLPVREDRLSDPVQADVLVSEDGLATAIRFVKTADQP